jgi:hypothetical protein
LNALVQALEQRAAEAEAEANTAEAHEAGARVRTEGVKEGVSAMWARLGCAELGLEELLGSEGVTDTNLMQYLGVIEQRANQLLLVCLLQDNSEFNASICAFSPSCRAWQACPAEVFAPLGNHAAPVPSLHWQHAGEPITITAAS